MQLKHKQTLATLPSPLPPSPQALNYTTALSWQSNVRRLAASNTDHYIYLYDETGTLREKFPTKPADKAVQPQYSITSLAFDPTNTRLAVGQTDSIVFIYKLGENYNDKKSICNKFLTSNGSGITTIAWPAGRVNDLVYGSSDGKVRLGNTKNNKSTVIYNATVLGAKGNAAAVANTELTHTDSYTVGLAVCTSGNNGGLACVSVHADGKLIKYVLSSETPVAAPMGRADKTNTPIVLQSNIQMVPSAVAYGENCIVVTSATAATVKFYNANNGELQSQYDFSSNSSNQKLQLQGNVFTCMAMHPTGKCVVLAAIDHLLVFTQQQQSGIWDYSTSLQVPNLHMVTSLVWKADGSTLCVSNSSGCVELYESHLRRYKICRGQYEVQYTSPSSVIITSVHEESAPAISLLSPSAAEITAVQVRNNRYIVCTTNSELILVDMKPTVAEHVRSVIEWSSSSHTTAKYNFDSESLVLIYSNGELHVIELGQNHILTSLRTEYSSPHLLSVGISKTADRRNNTTILAYLLDAHTIRLLNLQTSIPITTLNTNQRIEWLELNSNATKLLYRTTQHTLYLYDLTTLNTSTLIPYCNYVQWVPDTDVIVVQSHDKMGVWYNTSSVEALNEMTTIPLLAGYDIQDIQRDTEQTVVVCENVESGKSATVPLDQHLIQFTTVTSQQNYTDAIQMLDTFNIATPGVNAMWQSVGNAALQAGDYQLAARTKVATGDCASASYLQRLQQLCDKHGKDNYLVQAALAVYQHEYKHAEGILLQHGAIQEVIAMYTSLHMWQQALQFASHHTTSSVLQQLQQQYIQYLITHHQHTTAAELRLQQNDLRGAAELYIQGAYYNRAVALITKHQLLLNDKSLVQTLMTSLQQQSLYNELADMQSALGQVQQAYESYLQGKNFTRAIEIARQYNPAQVTALEEQYGDYLLTQQHQYDSAINAYIQAGSYSKAMIAAMDGQLWNRCMELLPNLSADQSQLYGRRIAQHYVQKKQYAEAERYFVTANAPTDAIQMYLAQSDYAAVHRLASQYMAPHDSEALYRSEAQRLIAANQLKQAEKLYTAVGMVDDAIGMYKQHSHYDDMIRLVQQHRSELLNDTYALIARQYTASNDLKQAEKYYLQGQQYAPAIQMYVECQQLEEALRVAIKSTDNKEIGTSLLKQMTVQLLLSQPAQRNTLLQLYLRSNIIDTFIEGCIEHQQFELAVDVLQILPASYQPMLATVYGKYGEYYEDNGKFSEAEQQFLRAQKPQEAIEMHLHQQNYDDAIRIARQYDSHSIADVYYQYAEHKKSQEQLAEAEQLYLQADRPDACVRMYVEHQHFDDAQRVAELHAPHLLTQLQSISAGKSNNAARSVQQPSQSYSTQSTIPAATSPNNLASVHQRAQQCIANKQPNTAIDLYMQADSNDSQQYSLLEQYWQSAVELAHRSGSGRLVEVVQYVAPKLIRIQKFAGAAEMYASIEMYPQAIEVYLEAEMYDEARALARSERPALLPIVDSAYQQSLIRNNNHQQLSAVNPDAAIELAVQQNQWSEVYRIASATGGKDAVQKYAAIQAAALMKDTKYIQALTVFVEHGCSVVPANFALYRRLTTELLSSHLLTDDVSQSVTVYSQLKHVLQQFVNELREYDSDSDECKEFQRLLTVVHYITLRSKLLFQQQSSTLNVNFLSTITKLSTSLLRYTDLLPCDRTYYMAGVDHKQMNHNNMTFIFWNRFLDLTDRILDADSGDINNADFVDTDLPSPFEIPLPEKLYYTDDQIEEVREWVLENAMTHADERKLSQIPCEKCNQQMYEGNLTCRQCRHSYAACIVSGYPVVRKQAVQCKSCQQPANKEEWNRYVMQYKQCSYCEQPAQPSY